MVFIKRGGDEMIKQILKNNRGEGYIDYVIGLFCIMIVLAFVVTIMPVFTTKQQLDIFATEIVREAEIKIININSSILIRYFNDNILLNKLLLKLKRKKVHIVKKSIRKKH